MNKKNQRDIETEGQSRRPAVVGDKGNRSNSSLCPFVPLPVRPFGRPLLIASAIGALIWVLAARILGPSDIWDQTQPKTISYTTDIIVHGGAHWILPMERGEFPATKPPLYNWLAVPMVKWLGFGSELAHKFPSIVALCLCWVMVIWLGRWIDSGHDQAVGWLAGLILLANYTMFKLGYLARPDMLLTLWLMLAWFSATAVLMRKANISADNADDNDKPTIDSHLCDRHHLRIAPGDSSQPQIDLNSPNHRIAKSPHSNHFWLIASFWICVTLAGLTKGPAAIVALLYPLIAARVLAGSWRASLALKPGWGIPFSLMAFGLWLYGVWCICPEHLQVLWHDETLGRFTGTGPQGNKQGLYGWFRTFPESGLHYLARFAPWSLCSIAAIVALWAQRKAGNRWTKLRGWRTCNSSEQGAPSGPWLYACAIQVVIVVLLFTLSASKRADYIAAAFGPGALLASWWLLRMGPRLAVSLPWLAPLVAAICLAALSAVNHQHPSAPAPGYGAAIKRFIDDAGSAIAAEPHDVAYSWVYDSQLQAMLGSSTTQNKEIIYDLIGKGRPFWVVAGRKSSLPRDFDEWLKGRRKGAKAQAVLRSATLPATRGWPEQVTLYRVTPQR